MNDDWGSISEQIFAKDERKRINVLSTRRVALSAFEDLWLDAAEWSPPSPPIFSDFRDGFYK